MSDSPYPPLTARHANGRFGPGNPGRPVGSVNRASRRAALAILDHFDSIQDRLLDRLSEYPTLYLKLLTYVLPRQGTLGSSEADVMSEAELAQAFSQTRMLVDGDGDRRAALTEIQAILVGEPARR